VADLLVLDRDIFTIEPSEIKDAKPVVTVVGGKAAHGSW
jgi:predicted amidohydrolase YtcJ